MRAGKLVESAVQKSKVEESHDSRVKRMRRYISLSANGLVEYLKNNNPDSEVWSCDLVNSQKIVSFNNDMSLAAYINAMQTDQKKNFNTMACIVFEIFRRYIPLPETAKTIGMYIDLVVGIASVMWNMQLKNMEVVHQLEIFARDHSILYDHPHVHTERLDKIIIDTLRAKPDSKSTQFTVDTNLSPQQIITGSTALSNLDGECILDVEKQFSVFTGKRKVGEFLQRVETIHHLLTILNRERPFRQFELIEKDIDQITEVIGKYVANKNSKNGASDEEFETRTEIINMCKANFAMRNLMQCGMKILIEIVDAVYDMSGRKCKTMLQKSNYSTYCDYDSISKLQSGMENLLKPGNHRRKKCSAETRKQANIELAKERICGVACYMAILLCSSQQRHFFPTQQAGLFEKPHGDFVPWDYGNNIMNMIDVTSAALFRKKMMAEAPPRIKYFPICITDNKTSFNTEHKQTLSPVTIRVLFGALAYNAYHDKYVPDVELTNDTHYENEYNACNDKLQAEISRVQCERTQKYAGAIIQGASDSVFHIFCIADVKNLESPEFTFGCFDALGDVCVSSGEDAHAGMFMGKDLVQFFDLFNLRLKSLNSSLIKVSFMRHTDKLGAFSYRSAFGVFLKTSNEEITNTIHMMDGHDV